MANIVLLTFANDRSAYLDQLKEESRSIADLLRPLEARDAIRLVREENAETRDVIEQISRHREEVVLFHYGGHADDRTLRFESGEGHAKGLAGLLGQLDRLKLVFLNGCSTRSLVEGLLEAGVPAVIATRAAIDDDRATAFARYFYHHLVHQGTLRRAFELARSSVLTDFRDIEVDDLNLVPVARGIRLPEAGEGDEMPWGLYYRDDQPEILDWALPMHSARQAAGSASFRPNEYLVHVPEAMAEHSPEFRERLSGSESEREALKLMVESFPWNIGSQVARLVGLQPPLSAPTPERLEQLLSTYLACKQFIYFVTLSELWQEVEDRALDHAREELHQVLNLTRENAITFDYLQRTIRLQRIMEDLQATHFVPELRGLEAQVNATAAGGQARDYLNSMLHRYVDSGAEPFASDIVRVCSEVEQYLTYWLYQLAFLANYWMVTVRDIRIERPRHREATFQHRVGRLNAFTENLLGLYEEPRAFPNFFFDHCVMLFRDLDQARECLVLSPFYIDKNAYVADRPPQMQLFTFGFRAPAGHPEADYYFINSGQNLFKAFAEERFQIHTGIELGGTANPSISRALMPWEKKHAKRVLPYASLKEQFETLNG